MKVFKLRRTNIVVIYFLVFLYLEIMFKIVTKIPIFNISFLYIVLNCSFLAFVLGGLHYLLKHAFDKILFLMVIFFSTLICCIEFCVFRIFSFYFSVSMFHAADQVVSFTGDAISLIWANIGSVMLLFLPFFLLMVGNRIIVVHYKSWKKTIVLELLAGC
ncbi:MAG: hypothetical protein K2M17_05075, partial [Bacilli bacterium]|nr:hypothetical protein [Bacilli bacterium]